MKRQYTVGQSLIYKWNDFDGKGEIECIVTEVCEDHVIAKSKVDGVSLYLDKDTEDMFYLN